MLKNDKNYLSYDIKNWLKSASIRCKKTTLSNYEYIVDSKISPYFSHVKRKNLNNRMINDYTDCLLKKGLSPKTVKDLLIILQQILTFADIDLKITLPKTPQKEIQILTKEEQQRLEKELLINPDNYKLGIYLSLYTGLRIGEICALKNENIDIKNKKIFIKATISRVKNHNSTENKKTIIILEEPKTTSSIREIPIPEFIVPLLKKYIDFQDRDCFFLTNSHKYIETRTFFNKYKKILDSIDLGKYNFHALRHTFATRCIESGCDPKTLSEILGHSNVKITLERYVHPDYNNKVKMINQLKPLI